MPVYSLSATMPDLATARILGMMQALLLWAWGLIAA
jgi:hypothetical protein